jgi:hypothetical protein
LSTDRVGLLRSVTDHVAGAPLDWPSRSGRGWGQGRPRSGSAPQYATFTPPDQVPPYADAEGPDGLLRYRYRGADPQHPGNVALRRAFERGRCPTRRSAWRRSAIRPRVPAGACAHQAAGMSWLPTDSAARGGASVALCAGHTRRPSLRRRAHPMRVGSCRNNNGSPGIHDAECYRRYRIQGALGTATGLRVLPCGASPCRDGLLH